MKQRNRGYIELLMVLIIALILLSFFWSPNMFQTTVDAVHSTVPQAVLTPIEQGRNAINAAQKAKTQLESQYNQQVAP